MLGSFANKVPGMYMLASYDIFNALQKVLYIYTLKIVFYSYIYFTKPEF